MSNDKLKIRIDKHFMVDLLTTFNSLNPKTMAQFSCYYLLKEWLVECHVSSIKQIDWEHIECKAKPSLVYALQYLLSQCRASDEWNEIILLDMTDKCDQFLQTLKLLDRELPYQPLLYHG